MAVKPKILVVDDETDLCALIKENLEEIAQFEIVTTSDPLIVEDLCEKEMPDLLLIDVVMPNRSGSEVIASLRKDPRTSSLPIVVMSGLGEMVYFKKKDKWRWLPNTEVVQNRGDILEEKDCRKAADAYGVDDYIEKPFSTEVLVEVLTYVLKKHNVLPESS
ncbi:MAG: response regulator [Candidatus Omnitrophica bacterium]|nr:response regulator [Candidatus Omnitrophota bacterium]